MRLSSHCEGRAPNRDGSVRDWNLANRGGYHDGNVIGASYDPGDMTLASGVLDEDDAAGFQPAHFAGARDEFRLAGEADDELPARRGMPFSAPPPFNAT